MSDKLPALPGLTTGAAHELGLPALLLVLGVSAVASFVVAGLYVVFYGARGTGSDAHRSFPLLGVSITAVFLSIQFSLPLSLGLLGALSIIRFRTPIKEPEEVGFIMLVIASALCCATFSLSLLGVLLAVATTCLVALRLGGRLLHGAPGVGTFVVTVPTAAFREKGDALLALLSTRLPGAHVDSVTTGADETTLSCRFRHLTV